MTKIQTAGAMKTDRRTLMTGAAAVAALGVFRPGPALAQSGDLEAIRRAVAEGKPAAIARLQDWIRNPSIAAENLNMPEGAEYMATLARDAGFENVRIIPTDGHPGVVGVIDVGAPRTLGVYFMYDVKQFDPAEWEHHPLAAELVDKPGFGLSVVGRGAVNQKGPENNFLSAIHALRAAGKAPPVNIVLICEGEEEIGSPHFKQVATHPDVLPLLQRCEGIFIPTGWQSPTTGGLQINLGAKGVIECDWWPRARAGAVGRSPTSTPARRRRWIPRPGAWSWRWRRS